MISKTTLLLVFVWSAHLPSTSRGFMQRVYGLFIDAVFCFILFFDKMCFRKQIRAAQYWQCDIADSAM